MTIDEAWDRWLNARAKPLTGEELKVAKTAFYAAFAAGAGEGAARTERKNPRAAPSHGALVVEMLRLFQELVRREGDVAVLLYGPSMAAVLEKDMLLLRHLVASLESKAGDAD